MIQVTRFPVLAAMLLCCATAHAGPPMICHPVDIEGARSLPWGSDAFATKSSFRLEDLADETIEILDRDPSVLVHMETLRRAAIYTDRDALLATTVLSRLMARALDAEAAGRPNALAWFDAGYLAQCYDQLGPRLDLRCGSAEGIVGYAWIQRAVELGGDDPALEFGAAMATARVGIPQHHAHVARVRTLADSDSLIARNLKHHAAKYWHHHRSRSRRERG